MYEDLVDSDLGIDLPEAVSSREGREALAQEKAEIEAAFQKFHAEVSVVLNQLGDDIDRLVKRITKEDPPREMAKLLTWTHLVHHAVCPKLVSVEGVHEPDLIGHLNFVVITVIAVVLREEFIETIPGFDALAHATRQLAAYRVRDFGRSDIPEGLTEGIERYEEQQYVHFLSKVLNLLSFSLSYSGIDRYDKRGRLLKPGVLRKAPSKNLQLQMDAFREKAQMALEEVFKSIDYTKVQSDSITQPDSSIETDPIGTFAPKAEANIAMKFMLLGTCLRSWMSIDSDQERARFNLEKLLEEIEVLGLYIERLGNLANDLATFGREMLEGFAGNSIIIYGIETGALTKKIVQDAFEEVLSDKRVTPTGDQDALRAKSCVRDFIDAISSEGCDASVVQKYADKFPALTHLLTAIAENNIYKHISDLWVAILSEAYDKIEGFSELQHFIDPHVTLRRAIIFREQYSKARNKI